MSGATEHESKIDATTFDTKNSDKKKILEGGHWVPCRICEGAFRRIRFTARYCDTCERAFCEGEHGNFAAQSRKGRCTSCGDKALGNIP
jgi:hypothetical protein